VEAGRPYSRLIQLLESVSSLSEEDVRLISRLPMTVKNVHANQQIARDGDLATQCCLVLNGHLYRHKFVKGSRRQILSFHIPGDIADLQTLHLPRLDYSLSALGPATVALIPHGPFNANLELSSRLSHVFWRQTLIDAAIFREWVINLGQRDALARVAHIICEMTLRLRAVGLTQDYSFSIPWTQSDLADAAGISAVHTNRVVQELRRLGLIEWDARRVLIRDWTRLVEVGDFSADYLHLRRPDDIDATLELC
jgi:CRP-like cAMP-binding protein